MTRRESPAERVIARPPIRLRILGPIDLCDEGGRSLDAVLSQPRRVALLTYLTLASRNGFIRRDHALAMFWPEHDAEHARAALSRAIYYLRQALGDDAVVSRGADEIAVPPNRVWCDAIALRGALGESRFDDAVGLYRGELLDGFFITGAPGFERWVEDERRCLAAEASRAAWATAERAERTGNHVLAARACQWAVDRSPLDEVGIRRLIAALDRAGDRAGAAMAFDRFAHRLAADLELPPAPETRALIQAIRARGSIVVPDHSTSVPTEHTPTGDPGRDCQKDDVTGDASPHSRIREPSRRRALVAMGIAGVAAILGGVSLATRRPQQLDQHRVAVVTLRDLPTGVASDSLAERMSQTIRDALVPTGLFGVVRSASPRGSVVVNESDAPDVARRAGAGLLVIAAVRGAGDNMFAEARVVETIGNRLRWVIPSPANMGGHATRSLDTVAERVVGALAALSDPRFDSWMPIAATLPPTFRAFEEFDRATDLKLRNRPREALAHYEAAAVLDPTFTWSMLEAAVAHMSAGDRPGADSVVDLLNLRRDELPPVQRHWLEWMLAVREEDWVRSFDALERAAELIPDRFLYGLAENARWLNRPRKSLELLNRLGSDGPPGGGFGYWYLMADSYHQLGEHPRELDVARRARRRHPQRPTAVIVEARARVALGDVAGAFGLVDTILALPRDGRDTPGTLMLQTAEEFRAHGYAAAAAELIDRAIRWFASRPAAEAALLETRRQHARAAYDAGRWSLADSLFRQLLRDDRDGIADHRAMLGAIAAHRGDTTEARRWLSVLQELTRSVNRPREDAIFGQARIAAVLGNTDEAVRLLREALGGQGQDLHADADFAALAADSAYQRFVRPKG